MKKISLKIAAALFAALMLLSVFAACGNTQDPTAETTAGQAVTDVAEVTTDSNYDDNGYLKDDLPDELDYKGETVTVLAWKDVEHEEFESDGSDGDIVMTSIYKRNCNTEDRLGVTIEWVRVDGDSDYRTSWNNYVYSAVSVNERAFDIIAGYSLSVALNASSGLCYNMLDTECEYLNFDQPWWSKLLVEQGTIYGKLWFASGDISRNALEMMYVCYANTDILTDYNLQNPQELVEPGDWTYENFINMCSGVYVDLDGSGTKTVGDQFGYMSSGIHLDPLFYGSGASICDKDDDGAIIPSESFTGERVINTIDMFIKLFKSSQDGLQTSDVKHQGEFGNGHLLFMTERARVSHKTLSKYADCNFIILPCPKYDKDQEDYVTVMGNPFTLYAISRDVEDPTLASAFVECFASEGYRNVTPAVFEISLKSKYVNDSISGQMYDIIRANLTYDPGRIFSSDLIGQGNFRTAVAATSNTWATISKVQAKSLQKKCDALNDAFAGY